jgi:hypothetical protein
MEGAEFAKLGSIGNFRGAAEVESGEEGKTSADSL